MKIKLIVGLAVIALLSLSAYGKVTVTITNSYPWFSGMYLSEDVYGPPPYKDSVAHNHFMFPNASAKHTISDEKKLPITNIHVFINSIWGIVALCKFKKDTSIKDGNITIKCSRKGRLKCSVKYTGTSTLPEFECHHYIIHKGLKFHNT